MFNTQDIQNCLKICCGIQQRAVKIKENTALCAQLGNIASELIDGIQLRPLKMADNAATLTTKCIIPMRAFCNEPDN